MQTKKRGIVDVDVLFAMRFAGPGKVRFLCSITPLEESELGAVTSKPEYAAASGAGGSAGAPTIDAELPELDLEPSLGLPPLYPPPIDAADTWNFDLGADVGDDMAFLLGLGLEEWDGLKES